MEWLKRKEKEQPIEKEEIYDVEVKESIETLKRQQEEMKTTISDLVRRIRTLERVQDEQHESYEEEDRTKRNEERNQR